MSAKVKSAKSAVVSFCNRKLHSDDFTQAKLDKCFAKVKSDDLARVKRYYVLLSDKRKVNVSDIMRYVANIALVWRKGSTGNLVGTYSTAQAMRVLVRLRVKVRDAHSDDKIIALSDVVTKEDKL